MKKIGAGDIADVVTRAQKECVHGVAMKYACAICFEEFATLRMRRLKTHVEYDYEPDLRALDPKDSPLMALLRDAPMAKNQPDWYEDELHPRFRELDALMDPASGYNPYDHPEVVSEFLHNRVGGTSNE